MLWGGDYEEGAIRPAVDEHVRDSIKGLRTDVELLSRLTEKRLALKESAGIGTQMDKEFAPIFAETLRLSERIEEEIRAR